MRTSRSPMPGRRLGGGCGRSSAQLSSVFFSYKNRHTGPRPLSQFHPQVSVQVLRPGRRNALPLAVSPTAAGEGVGLGWRIELSGVLRCRVRPTESESRHAPQGDSQSGRHRQNLAANHGANGTFALRLRHRRNNPLKVWLCSGLILGPILLIVRLTPSLCAPTQQANPPTFRTRR